MSKVYIVYPPQGWGSNVMVIKADTPTEAQEMFFKEAGMNTDYYKSAREQGCQDIWAIDDSKGVKYVRQDNL